MSRTHSIIWIAVVPTLVLATLVGTVALAGNVSVPHAFSPGQVADANQVNECFAKLAAEINDNHARIATLETDLATANAKVADLESLLTYFSRNGTDVYLTGANLHVLSGSGSTDGTVNGLGNVIVGYNEKRTGTGATNTRTGSHMLVVGRENNFSSYGGIVAGYANETSGKYACVSGGAESTATGVSASVSGGYDNTASGTFASVSGGATHDCRGYTASVSGGYLNTVGTYSYYSSVSGGVSNTASGYYSSVSGGAGNTASGNNASVSGGRNNNAGYHYSTCSGGNNKDTTAVDDHKP